MPARDDTLAVLGAINHELGIRYEAGEPLELHLSGRPDFQVLSFDPLAVESFGRILNRPPKIDGTVALRAFLSRPHYDGSRIVYAGVEAGDKAYGFCLDGKMPYTEPLLENAAGLLGISVEFTR